MFTFLPLVERPLRAFAEEAKAEAVTGLNEEGHDRGQGCSGGVNILSGIEEAEEEEEEEDEEGEGGGEEEEEYEGGGAAWEGGGEEGEGE